MNLSVWMSLRKQKSSSSLLFLCGTVFLLTIVGVSYFSDIYSVSQLFEGIFVFAQGADEGMSDMMSTSLDLMQGLIQIIYIIMWPLMYIAGLAMDNSLVYGEFINLDGVLWTMWGISKNLANFALGGFVLYEVIKYAFMGQDSNVSNIYNVLRGALVAGVGIQFSWFLLAALIDISTILIVSLGGLPLTLMENFGFGNQPILGVQGYLNLSDTNNGNSNKSDALVYYTWGKFKFPSCRVVNGYVVGGAFNNTVNETLNFTQNGQDKRYCALGTQTMINITGIEKDANTVADSLQQVLRYDTVKKLSQAGNTPLSVSDQTFLTDMDGEHPADDISGPSINHHVANIKSIVDTIPGRSTDIEGGPEIESTSTAGNSVDWKKEFVANPQIRGKGTYLSDITQDGQGFVGPLTTLYVSILEFSNLHSTASGTGETATGMSYFFEFMLKSLVGLMLIVPLIILAVVLIIRVAILWVVIAFSPIIALLRGFEQGGSKKGDGITIGSTTLNMKNIIGMIFAPVLPVFILSLSIVFLQALSSRFYDPANTGSWESMGITLTHNTQAQETCATIRGAMTFCYESSSDDTGNSIYANLFAWLLVNMFAIGLMWTLVKMSFQGNEIVQGVANNITKTAASVAGSIPIIPLPGAGGSGFVGRDAFSSITGIGSSDGSSAITAAIKNKFSSDTYKQIERFKGEDKEYKEASEKKDQKAAETKFFENLGTNFTANKSTAERFASEVLNTDVTKDEEKKQLISNFDTSALDTKSEELLQIGFKSDIEDAIKKAKLANATEADIDTARAYLNGSIGTKYQSTPGALSLEERDYNVVDAQGQAQTLTIKKVNGKFEKTVVPVLASTTPTATTNTTVSTTNATTQNQNIQTNTPTNQANNGTTNTTANSNNSPTTPTANT